MKKTILALVVVGLMVCANGAFAQLIDSSQSGIVVARDLGLPSDISFINIVGSRFPDPATPPPPFPLPESIGDRMAMIKDDENPFRPHSPFPRPDYPAEGVANMYFDNIIDNVQSNFDNNFFTVGLIKSDTDPFTPRPTFPEPKPFGDRTAMLLGGVENMNTLISNVNFDSIIGSNGFTNVLSMSKFNEQQNVMSNALINLNDSIQQVAFNSCDGVNIFDKICIGSSK